MLYRLAVGDLSMYYGLPGGVYSPPGLLEHYAKITMSSRQRTVPCLDQPFNKFFNDNCN